MFLAWLHAWPCIACYARVYLANGGSKRTVISSFERDWYCFDAVTLGQQSQTEAAHVGARGASQKCPDREAIPLCGIEHHREGPESAHKLQKRFWEHHGINKRRIIAAIVRQYEIERAA